MTGLSGYEGNVTAVWSVCYIDLVPSYHCLGGPTVECPCKSLGTDLATDLVSLPVVLCEDLVLGGCYKARGLKFSRASL